MRLTPKEIETIKTAAVEVFGTDAIIRLFGSRVDDSKRGGDIDLYIEAAPERANSIDEQRFRVLLWQRLEEPQIDVVLASRDTPARWIDRAARRDGIVL